MNLPHNIQEWVTKAEADFQTAVTMARKKTNPVPDVVGFHCQQCIEKYLKAFLTWKMLNFSKTHDLLGLLELALLSEPILEKYRDDLRSLNPFSVQFRYPGENADIEEAKEALTRMKKLRKYFQERLGIKEER
ncbi:MAG: HEPN domain-containing protein [Candidatus Schekmanbacteria bacterium]|nr:HEPN domain-containing protein [Candidatus Schekmanbacteria bacterium]